MKLTRLLASRSMTHFWQAASLAALSFGLLAAPAAHAQQPRNIIILFADGTTATQHDFGRYSSEVLRRQPYAVTSEVMRKGAFGLMTTSSANAYVTDSAAAASAMSTGFKVDNGAVSITPDGATPTTLMELARTRGKKIGIISTATVYDASPAAFSVHAKSRRDYQQIVDQYATLKPDVLLGGGLDFFLPAAITGGKRTDARNMVEVFRTQGYAVARTPAELAAASGPKLLGLFADEDMDFEIDRDAKQQPSLAQMTAAALKILSPALSSTRSPTLSPPPSPAPIPAPGAANQGFVLFVENENTDTAGHRNDVAALMRDLWAFDDAVKVALDFRKRHPDTLVIVTGDHETGGFSPTWGRRDNGKASVVNQLQVDETQLRRIERFSMSLQELADRVAQKTKTGAKEDEVMTYLTDLFRQHFPGIDLNDDIRALLRGNQLPALNFAYAPVNTLGQQIARQTGFYWGTSGHTSAPAVVGAIGPGEELFRGFRDNTEFARSLQQLLQTRPARAAGKR